MTVVSGSHAADVGLALRHFGLYVPSEFFEHPTDSGLRKDGQLWVDGLACGSCGCSSDDGTRAHNEGRPYKS